MSAYNLTLLKTGVTVAAFWAFIYLLLCVTPA